MILPFQTIFSPAGRSQKTNPSPFCLSPSAGHLPGASGESWPVFETQIGCSLSRPHATGRISLPSLGQPSSGGIVSTSLCRGRAKQNSRICCLLASQNTSFCLQQNQCHLSAPFLIREYKCERNSSPAFHGHLWWMQFRNFSAASCFTLCRGRV